MKSLWLRSWKFDLPVILLPPFIVTAIVFIFRDFFTRSNEIPLWFWVLCVIAIDVSHVYSSLFRTYFDPDFLREQKKLLIGVPLFSFAIAAVCYQFGADIFWRFLAYIAVFHFIRQQYGFLALYSRKVKDLPKALFRFDCVLIYVATIYPLFYWHTHDFLRFSWFIEGDFFKFHTAQWEYVSIAYFLLLLIYFIKEIYLLGFREQYFSLPKNLLIIGTIVVWYVGIVLYNSDAAFTLTNVVAHGIPYIGLVWLYGNKKWANKSGVFNTLFSPKKIFLFLLPLVVLAYLEEGAWDIFVWREHLDLFPNFNIQVPSHTILSFIVPILILPQLTHYILDAFIWRVRKPDVVMEGILKLDQR